MHPSKSIIFFTVISGTGYGIFISLLFISLFIEISFSFNYKLFLSLVSFIMIVSGLLSSTLHLGHPERAWRAFSQWKTSWLSREGLAALLTFIPMIFFYIFWIYNIQGHLFFLLITSFFSIITIYCTGQMYASLKTVPAWNNILVTPIYIFNGISVGAIFVYSLNFYFEYNLKLYESFIYVILTLNFILKLIYWFTVNKKIKTNSQTAIGLKSNNINFFEGPHTGKNYLTTEMINIIGKNNGNFLRIIFCILTFVTPLYMINQYSNVVASLFIIKLTMMFVFILSLVGMIIERYLFFIQSKHVVGIYYGNKI